MEKIFSIKLPKMNGSLTIIICFLNTGNPISKNFDFFKRFGTLYDLLNDLINEKINILNATKE